MAKLKEETIVERWSVLIDGANGMSKEFFRKTEENLKELAAPNVKLVQKKVSPSLARKLKGEARTFLVAKNNYLRGYLMYIGAIDYGKQLFVSWYLTLEPGRLWKFLVSLPWWIHLFILPFTLIILIYNKLFRRKSVAPAYMDLFDLEEVTAYAGTVHHTVVGVTKTISQSVGFDFTKVDQRSKGFFNIS